jgi:hypothetical protein
MCRHILRKKTIIRVVFEFRHHHQYSILMFVLISIIAVRVIVNILQEDLSSVITLLMVRNLR